MKQNDAHYVLQAKLQTIKCMKTKYKHSSSSSWLASSCCRYVLRNCAKSRLCDINSS